MKKHHIFCYIPQNSPIHRADSRLKLLIILFWGIFGSFFSNYLISIIWTLFLICSIISAKLPIKSLLGNSLSLLLLCLVVLLTRKFDTAAINYCWHLFLLLLGGNLLIQTTSLTELRFALKSLLKPLPFINENHIATLFSLTFTMIPVIFEEVEAVSEAAKSRCIENKKNPLLRVLSLVYPLLMQIIRRATAISDAMESRGYNY